MITSKQIFSTLLLTIAMTLSLLIPGEVLAQSNVTTTAFAPTIFPLQVTSIDTEELWTISDNLESVMASYPGGQEQLEIFLKDHVEYPELARDNNFEGTTIIRFKVLANGQLDQYTVQQSTHEICDQEVIKALKEMAPWTSAKLLGKEVASWRAVAVDFKMKF